MKKRWQSPQGNLERHRHQLRLSHPHTRVRRQHQVQDQGHNRRHLLEARPPEVGVLQRKRGSFMKILNMIMSFILHLKTAADSRGKSTCIVVL